MFTFPHVDIPDVTFDEAMGDFFDRLFHDPPAGYSVAERAVLVEKNVTGISDSLLSFYAIFTLATGIGGVLSPQGYSNTDFACVFIEKDSPPIKAAHRGVPIIQTPFDANTSLEEFKRLLHGRLALAGVNGPIEKLWARRRMLGCSDFGVTKYRILRHRKTGKFWADKPTEPPETPIDYPNFPTVNKWAGKLRREADGKK